MVLESHNCTAGWRGPCPLSLYLGTLYACRGVVIHFDDLKLIQDVYSQKLN